MPAFQWAQPYVPGLCQAFLGWVADVLNRLGGDAQLKGWEGQKPREPLASGSAGKKFLAARAEGTLTSPSLSTFLAQGRRVEGLAQVQLALEKD